MMTIKNPIGVCPLSKPDFPGPFHEETLSASTTGNLIHDRRPIWKPLRGNNERLKKQNVSSGVSLPANAEDSLPSHERQGRRLSLPATAWQTSELLTSLKRAAKCDMFLRHGWATERDLWRPEEERKGGKGVASRVFTPSAKVGCLCARLFAYVSVCANFII